MELTHKEIMVNSVSTMIVSTLIIKRSICHNHLFITLSLATTGASDEYFAEALAKAERNHLVHTKFEDGTLMIYLK